MSRNSLALLLVVGAIPAGCGDDPKVGDTEGVDSCDIRTIPLPADSGIHHLFRERDGTLWAAGEAGGVLRHDGETWRRIDELSSQGYCAWTAEGDRIWAINDEELAWTTGEGWSPVPLDLEPGELLYDAQGLGDGRVVASSCAGCDEQTHLDLMVSSQVVLWVGDADGFEPMDLGLTHEGRAALGTDGAGHALVARGSAAWYWTGTEWSWSALPMEEAWRGVLYLDDRWVLMSSDGTLLSGVPDDWTIEETGVSGYWFAGTSRDALWLLGSDPETGATTLSFGDSAGWTSVPVPEAQLYSIVADGETAIIGGTVYPNPVIASGDPSGISVDWTATPIVGEGAAWSSPDGRVFLAQSRGTLSMYDDGQWTSLYEDEVWLVDVVGHEGVVHALSTGGLLVTWDGEDLELDDTVAVEGDRYELVTVTDDGAPVIAGYYWDAEVEELRTRLEVKVGGAWTSLTPPKGNLINAVLASSLDELLVGTDLGLHLGDGERWVTLSEDVEPTDLARTADGRVWVATLEDGLFELLGGALVAVPDAPPRVEHLLTWENVVFAQAYDHEARLDTILRWDGAWTEIASFEVELSHTIMAVEGGDLLWIFEESRVNETCLVP